MDAAAPVAAPSTAAGDEPSLSFVYTKSGNVKSVVVERATDGHTEASPSASPSAHAPGDSLLLKPFVGIVCLLYSQLQNSQKLARRLMIPVVAICVLHYALSILLPMQTQLSPVELGYTRPSRFLPT